MPERLIPLTTFAGAAALAGQMGFSPDWLLEQAGIEPSLILDPQATITARQYDALAVFAQELLQDPAFALHIGEMIRPEILDIGALFTSAPTVRVSLQQFLRFRPLLNPCGDLSMEEDGDEVRLYCYLPPDQGLDGRFHHAEGYLSAIWHQAWRLTGKKLPLRRIDMMHDGSAWLDQYRRIFGDEVVIRFNAEENMVALDRALLDLPQIGASPRLYEQMERLALQRLAQVPQLENTTMAVLRTLEEHLGERVLDLEDVARLLGMTTRTLQRRLRDEQTTYQAVRDMLRHRQAQRMLRDATLDVATIAATLGFSEPATFYRAFKAWGGLSPSEYRRRQGIGSVAPGDDA